MGCRGEAQLPSDLTGGGIGSAPTPSRSEGGVPLGEADSWPTADLDGACEIRWFGPDPAPRNGNSVELEIEVSVTEGTHLTDVHA
jgi:hypothetical protein